jgi:hypothetical protein
VAVSAVAVGFGAEVWPPRLVSSRNQPSRIPCQNRSPGDWVCSSRRVGDGSGRCCRRSTSTASAIEAPPSPPATRSVSGLLHDSM